MGTTFSAEQWSEKWRAHTKSIKGANASKAAQSFRTENLLMPWDTNMSETEARTYSLLKPQIDPISYSKTTFAKSSEEVELLSPLQKSRTWSPRLQPTALQKKSLSCLKFKSMQPKKKLIWKKDCSNCRSKRRSWVCNIWRVFPSKIFSFLITLIDILFITLILMAEIFLKWKTQNIL